MEIAWIHTMPREPTWLVQTRTRHQKNNRMCLKKSSFQKESFPDAWKSHKYLSQAICVYLSFCHICRLWHIPARQLADEWSWKLITATCNQKSDKTLHKKALSPNQTYIMYTCTFVKGELTVQIIASVMDCWIMIDLWICKHKYFIWARVRGILTLKIFLYRKTCIICTDQYY